MQIDRNKRGTVVVVAPHGSLDIDTRKVFVDMLFGLLDTGETAILVDLSHVDFMTSTGLSAMLFVAKRVEKIAGLIFTPTWTRRWRSCNNSMDASAKICLKPRNLSGISDLATRAWRTFESGSCHGVLPLVFSGDGS
jgi:anti-anti-sigma factor